MESIQESSMVVELKAVRRCRDMVAKDDKDGQIALLRDALEKIQKIAEGGCDEWTGAQIFADIEKTARTALIDTTF